MVKDTVQQATAPNLKASGLIFAKVEEQVRQKLHESQRPGAKNYLSRFTFGPPYPSWNR